MFLKNIILSNISKERINNLKKRKFPTFATILLVLGIVWLLNEINILTINIPWIPVVLIIIALGMIINRFVSE